MPEQMEASMEILGYYIIAALSFALMYSISYGWEIIQTVLDVLNLFDMNYIDEDTWNPWYYMTAVFIMSLIAMPLFLFLVLAQNKYETIKFASAHILQKYYGFEQESDDTEL